MVVVVVIVGAMGGVLTRLPAVEGLGQGDRASRLSLLLGGHPPIPCRNDCLPQAASCRVVGLWGEGAVIEGGEGGLMEEG